MEWTDEAVAELRRLWAEGLPTKAIGAALRLNKNQVIGKAHRLDLPGRGSPIKSVGQKAAPKPNPSPTSTLLPLPSLKEAENLNGRIVTMRANGGPPARIALGLPVTAVYKRAARNRGNLVSPPVPGTPRRRTSVEPLTPAPPPPEPEIDRLAGVVFKPRPPGACCWPLWGTARITHRYCGAPADARRSYCDQHARIAYTRVA